MTRIKTPTILQMEATECGAAALAIVLAYYGRYIPLEKLRIECGVSRDGCNAVIMLQAARKHGLRAQGAKFERLEELQQVRAPAILFWEFNHFVVWEGMKGEKVYINDPASGPRVLDETQFNKSFTGVALVLEPTPEFTRCGIPPSLFSGLRRRTRGMATEIKFILLASIILIVPNLLVIAFTKVFIDCILLENITSWQIPFLTLFVLNIAAVGLITWLQTYYLLLSKVKLLMVGSIRLLWHVICLPVNFFQQRFTGDIIERISANDRIAHLLSSELMSALTGLVTLVIYGFILLLMSWQLALIAFVVTACNYLVYRLIARQYADINFNFLQKNSKLLGFSMIGLYLIEDLKANGREDDFFQRWSGLHAEIISLQQKQSILTQVLTVVPFWLQTITVVVILCYGSFLIINSVITIGTLVAFQLLLTQFTAPIQAILALGNDVQKIKGDLFRQDDILNYEVDQRLLKQQSNTVLSPSICLDNVSFSYSPLKPMLEGLNISIKAGETFAVMGKSGEGKSTIAKLIAGLYQPQTGTIFIGGIPMHEIDAASLANQLSYVDQDVFLYAGTVRENITLWKKNIPDEAIEKALQDACLFEVIQARGGLDCKVLENGINFSGGQRQRIEIARALAQNPALLILDEATSNLDVETEQTILENIKKRNCTTMIVTHRKTALQGCDSIYILEKGQLKKMENRSD
ncbi:cysteine peptidase family C39 domain-containing protein [Legionella micdadei]|uniref:ABC-type bacteriocin/lantibiotic exporters, contain an N-terminal double-glycine peptidase domain n=1 Tax=Legionella micdadei TaxID=451 RepID=A0A098GJ43_LEGMI|nr:cysteine peptidase family C39 domain-containing protein [Legionella micdadei]ARG97057.1 hypothetical protein B6N58_04895 [Legionella micdadei]KTD26780.1 hypothetical protein Lmic_2874 [Legionella micdadei]NSL18281.1 ATP-binding cassette domain-containing protein [Legionella micdadei]CEG61521.1 ABC-type bacteriocin/lantibiotic exporters, contain an N-terminal double-glycine peptidase domain [Legionella micdadei]SCY44998.1 NHLM bacteriocin system ABC transporter, peptidase/ATP-binding protein